MENIENFHNYQQYDFLLETISDVIWAYDLEKQVFSFVSPSIEKILGYSPENFLKFSLSDIIPIKYSKKIISRFKKYHEYLQNNKKKLEYTDVLQVLHNDGTVRWIEVISSFKKNKYTSRPEAIGTFRDITERKKQELEMSRMRLLINDAAKLTRMGAWEYNAQNNLYTVSPEWLELYGLRKDEFSGKIEEIFQMIHPEDLEKVKELSYKAFVEKKTIPVTFRIIRSDGEIRYLRSFGEVEFDESGKLYRMLGFAQDITEQKLNERNIHNALHEKSLLLQELYHRTRNNLQVISSLLHLQCLYSDSEESRNELIEAENRIYVFSLIQKKMYQSQSLSKINVKDYINELLNYLFESYNVQSDKIKVESNIENIDILIDIATPLSLVLNELFTNVLKHAFPDRNGTLFIDLIKKNEVIFVTVRDDGIGVPNNFDFSNIPSFGMNTIFNLVKKQLYGNIQFFSENGLHCSFNFRSGLYKERLKNDWFLKK